MSIRTYPIAEVAAEICGDSMAHPERWLTEQIRAGRFTARKIGRHWRMTQADVDAALEAVANKTTLPPSPPLSPPPGPAAAPTAAISATAMRRRRMNPTHRGIPA